MKNTKTLLAISLVAIAAIAIGVGMSSNVFAQPTAPAASSTVDPQDGPNEGQNSELNATNHTDGETNDDQKIAKVGPTSDGDGEQNDKTELK